MKQKQFLSYFVIIMLIIGFVGLAIHLQIKSNQIKKLKQDNQLAMRLISLDYGYSEDKTDAERYYEEASLSYERQDYINTEAKCKSARESYSKHIQNVKREQIEKRNYTENIFNIYNQMLDEEIKVSESIYEACEWFEEASRHYDYYFKETTPYDDPSYEQGGSAIEEMNKKINAHDDAVRRYNYLLEEFNIEKDKIVGDYLNE